MVNRDVNMMSEYDRTFQYTSDDFLAGILVTAECTIGTFMLIGVIIGSFRIPALKTSFGKLMINQNVAQLLACLNSGIFFLFGVVFNLNVVESHGSLFGDISILLLPVILGSFFLMSLNRFCASSMPFKYQRIFSNRLLRFFIVINWILPLLAWIYVIIIRECNFVFYHYGWLFTEQVRNQNCGGLVLNYAMYVQLSLNFIVFGLDVTTLAILILYRAKIYKTNQSAEVRRREINFASQVIIQGVVFIAHGFWYDMGYRVLPGDSENWKFFLTTSFSSNLLHVFDPAIVFIFNKEMRNWVFRTNRDMRKVTVVSSVANK